MMDGDNSIGVFRSCSHGFLMGRKGPSTFLSEAMRDPRPQFLDSVAEVLL